MNYLERFSELVDEFHAKVRKSPPLAWTVAIIYGILFVVAIVIFIALMGAILQFLETTFGAVAVIIIFLAIVALMVANQIRMNL